MTDQLEEIIDGYMECALWASTDGEEGNLDDRYITDDIEGELRSKMRTDCGDFFGSAGDALGVVINRLKDASYGGIGHDFWLTRNRHGTGFWDRYSGPDLTLVAALKHLSDLSHNFGEYTIYVGDDGKLYGCDG
jgi:hypothetical protein